MHEKRFTGDIERLRSPERIARLEVEKVVDRCLETAALKSMVDIGVGSGLFAEAFSRRGLQVAGVDVNPAMLAAARHFVPAGDFRQAAAEALPYPDASFDLAFYGLVLHESDEPLRVLQEARRVARVRVCILEWPYHEQQFGPPMAHRLDPAVLTGLFRSVGFAAWEMIAHEAVVLYRLEI